MKYVNMKADETHLAEVEILAQNISRLEGAIANLRQREASITQTFSPPALILKHYEADFMQKTGVFLPPIDVSYPVYLFEYVSAGGNSSQRTTVTLDGRTIDALIETMSQSIRFRKSAAGQRALMTAKLRNSIESRDGRTCRLCAISLAAEPHLILEVDHIENCLARRDVDSGRSSNALLEMQSQQIQQASDPLPDTRRLSPDGPTTVHPVLGTGHERGPAGGEELDDAATSAGVPTRHSGVAASSRSRVSSGMGMASTGIMPGLMALTVIPQGPNAVASSRVN